MSDSLGRTTSKTRTIDGNAYATQYQYNQINQLGLMIYPSGKRVRENFDSRDRFNEAYCFVIRQYCFVINLYRLAAEL